MISTVVNGSNKHANLTSLFTHRALVGEVHDLFHVFFLSITMHFPIIDYMSISNQTDYSLLQYTAVSVLNRLLSVKVSLYALHL